MPPYSYHIRNKVTGLDLTGYIYKPNLAAAKEEADRLRSKFGKSTKLIAVERVRVEMPVKGKPKANSKAETKLARKQSKKHRQRRR